MDFSFIPMYSQDFIDGFLTTLKASILALVLSVVLGGILAVLRMSDHKLAQFVGRWYVEVFQNTPLPIQIFFFYIGLPSLGIQLSEFTSGMLGLGVYTAAYMAEVFRAGIQSVPKGQMEAARSTGMTYLQAMWYVILPQAVRIIIPPMGNQFLNLVKNSAMLGFIAAGDLMYHAYIVQSETFLIVEVYLFTALLYLMITIPLSIFVNYLERRMAKGW